MNLASVKFQGIYKIQFNNGKSLNPEEETDRRKFEETILPVLIAENPKTSHYITEDGFYIFRDDKAGNHFSKEQKIIAPVIQASEQYNKAVDDRQNPKRATILSKLFEKFNEVTLDACDALDAMIKAGPVQDLWVTLQSKK